MDAPGAAASATSSLQAQASTISSELSQSTSRLHQLAESYVSEHQLLDGALSQVHRLGARISELKQRITSARAALRDEAITAYVHDDSGTTFDLALQASPVALSSSGTYLQVASRQLTETSVLLGNSVQRLDLTLSAERTAVMQASAAQAATASERLVVLQDIAKEQSVYNSVHGQLAALVAAQQQAALAAAARARKLSVAPPSIVNLVTPGGSTPASIGSLSQPNLGGSLAQDFAGIRNCESGGRYYLDTGNGYYGAYQFSYWTWRGLGGTGLASDAPPAAQDALAYRLYQSSGWHAWPECAAILGLG